MCRGGCERLRALLTVSVADAVGAAAFAPASPALSLRGAQPPRSIRSGAAAVSMTADCTRSDARRSLCLCSACLIACAINVGLLFSQPCCQSLCAESKDISLHGRRSSPLSLARRITLHQRTRTGLTRPIHTHVHAYRATRRETLAASAAAALALLAPNKPAVAAGLALGYGVSEKDANAQLAAFGLPTMDKVRSYRVL